MSTYPTSRAHPPSAPWGRHKALAARPMPAFWECDVCGCNVHHNLIESHIAGQKHKRKLRKIEKEATALMNCRRIKVSQDPARSPTRAVADNEKDKASPAELPSGERPGAFSEIPSDLVFQELNASSTQLSSAAKEDEPSENTISQPQSRAQSPEILSGPQSPELASEQSFDAPLESCADTSKSATSIGSCAQKVQSQLPTGMSADPPKHEESVAKEKCETSVADSTDWNDLLDSEPSVPNMASAAEELEVKVPEKTEHPSPVLMVTTVQVRPPKPEKVPLAETSEPAQSTVLERRGSFPTALAPSQSASEVYAAPCAPQHQKPTRYQRPITDKHHFCEICDCVFLKTGLEAHEAGKIHQKRQKRVKNEQLLLETAINGLTAVQTKAQGPSASKSAPAPAHIAEEKIIRNEAPKPAHDSTALPLPRNAPPTSPRRAPTGTQAPASRLPAIIPALPLNRAPSKVAQPAASKAPAPETNLGMTKIKSAQATGQCTPSAQPSDPLKTGSAESQPSTSVDQPAIERTSPTSRDPPLSDVSVDSDRSAFSQRSTPFPPPGFDDYPGMAAFGQPQYAHGFARDLGDPLTSSQRRNSHDLSVSDASRSFAQRTLLNVPLQDPSRDVAGLRPINERPSPPAGAQGSPFQGRMQSFNLPPRQVQQNQSFSTRVQQGQRGPSVRSDSESHTPGGSVPLSQGQEGGSIHRASLRPQPQSPTGSVSYPHSPSTSPRGDIGGRSSNQGKASGSQAQAIPEHNENYPPNPPLGTTPTLTAPPLDHLCHQFPLQGLPPMWGPYMPHLSVEQAQTWQALQLQNLVLQNQILQAQAAQAQGTVRCGQLEHSLPTGSRQLPLPGGPPLDWDPQSQEWVSGQEQLPSQRYPPQSRMQHYGPAQLQQELQRPGAQQYRSGAPNQGPGLQQQQRPGYQQQIPGYQQMPLGQRIPNQHPELPPGYSPQHQRPKAAEWTCQPCGITCPAFKKETHLRSKAHIATIRLKMGSGDISMAQRPETSRKLWTCKICWSVVDAADMGAHVLGPHHSKVVLAQLTAARAGRHSIFGESLAENGAETMDDSDVRSAGNEDQQSLVEEGREHPQDDEMGEQAEGSLGGDVADDVDAYLAAEAMGLVQASA
ncbi:hypothetical protein FN846DRAFT_895891 [Sphaerosporella brunnea]|uniref:U1-type domain-containing protein n=1 Tax=Sphaerosporella brunnea TaxID=1250544 RepID=A0A5J5EDA1_9PEZI|nr:hypothetical protein FN846DRAFT_895891 [Sphaerosporella brunnea]